MRKESCTQDSYPKSCQGLNSTLAYCSATRYFVRIGALQSDLAVFHRRELQFVKLNLYNEKLANIPCRIQIAYRFGSDVFLRCINYRDNLFDAVRHTDTTKFDHSHVIWHWAVYFGEYAICLNYEPFPKCFVQTVSNIAAALNVLYPTFSDFIDNRILTVTPESGDSYDCLILPWFDREDRLKFGTYLKCLAPDGFGFLTVYIHQYL
jgi:hypothetical protein